MRTASIETAIAALIDVREFDVAAFLAEKLPKSRQWKALRKIVRAI